MFYISPEQKQQSILNIFQLSKYLDDAFMYPETQTRMHTNLSGFCEFFIWNQLARAIALTVDFENMSLSLLFNRAKIATTEILLSDFIQLDKSKSSDQYFVEISIQKISQTHGNKHAPQLEGGGGRRNSKHTDLLPLLIKPIEYILYTETSNFTFLIKAIKLKSAELIHYHINSKEVINFYIAEGLYKFMANYMNSRLSYNDIKIISRYIVYKIRSANFLDMMEINSQVDIFRNQDPALSNQDPHIYQISKNHWICTYLKTVKAKGKIVLKTEYYTQDCSFKFTATGIDSGAHITIHKPLHYFDKCLPYIEYFANPLLCFNMLQIVSRFYQSTILEKFKRNI